MADVIHVPADYPTIQEAINAASHGDEIIVADGVYTGEGNRDIDFLGLTITVRSENGPDACTIDCEEEDRAFHFRNAETNESVLQGFTITNGMARRGIDEFGGGAIACTEGSDPTIANCRLTGNQSVNDGGGAIFCENSNPRIVECEMTLNTSNGGGAVICIASSPSILNCEIVENRAIDGTGGGISLSMQSRPLIEGCTIAGNEANTGGGIRCLVSDPTIVGCTIEGNAADEGGGISLSDFSSPLIRNTTITQNEARSLEGGGIRCFRQSSPQIEGCTIAGNTGSGIWCRLGSSPRIEDCLIADNSARGIWSRDQSSLEILRCVVRGNRGGFYCEAGGNVLFQDCLITENSHPNGGGGGLNCQAPVRLVNCVISKNFAEVGGGIFCESGPTIINCTLVGNRSDRGSTAILTNDGCAPRISNTIIWDNRIVAKSGRPVVTYSDVQGGWSGEGNIDADPLFVDPDNGNYRLGEASPAIDAASNDAIIPAGVDTDLDGNPRFVDDPDTQDTGQGECQIVDMGSYEFQAVGGCCVRFPQWICDGDVDGDGQVNPVDSGIVQAHFGSQEGLALCNYDVDCDGQINPVDSGIVQSLFGTCEEPRSVCP